jgi:hypothetical protein
MMLKFFLDYSITGGYEASPANDQYRGKLAINHQTGRLLEKVLTELQNL